MKTRIRPGIVVIIAKTREVLVHSLQKKIGISARAARQILNATG